MPEDVKDVQPDEVSKETESKESEEAQTPALTEERIAELIQSGVEKTIEPLKRQMQSEKDKAIAEIQRKANSQVSEKDETLAAIRGRYSELDPDAQSALRIAEVEAKEKVYSKRDATDAQREQLAAFDQGFYSDMTQFVTESGIDPTDKRIDWGLDSRSAGDYKAVQKKILSSVTKIIKDNEKAQGDSIAQKMKEFEAKTRKDLGLDEVVTDTPTAAPGKLTAKGIEKMSTEERWQRRDEIDGFRMGYKSLE